ncbi:hypothetical protein [Agrobacterium pusense]|jgi:hypothetical protein|uniref:hypothetical protein n=1 Tax=Agrobacterium pusense TaxID=648995 RepID=UPI0032DAE78D
MSISDYDLDILADQIIARINSNNRAPNIFEIAQHIDVLGFPAPIADTLGRLIFEKCQHPQLKPKHIVVLVHGIRTHAEWHGLAAKVFEPYCMKVVPIKFDFLDLIRFWFPIPLFFRNGPIKRVEDNLKSIIADYPSAHVSIVAHSFGTYVTTKIIKRNFNIRLFRLLMCGSIVSLKYDWRRLPNKPRGGLMNDVGLKDRLPILAEVSTWGYGPSGTYGFGCSEVDDNFHDFGHSGFFTEAHVSKYWVPFLFHGKYIVSPENATRTQPKYPWQILRLSQLKYLIGASVLWWGVVPWVKRFISNYA